MIAFVKNAWLRSICKRNQAGYLLFLHSASKSSDLVVKIDFQYSHKKDFKILKHESEKLFAAQADDYIL
ncbi:MAG: hypothetical protein MI922_16285 [Bacteroidales bacterium]|nr:hypothetical protein [Bacteroidales bacterium]